MSNRTIHLAIGAALTLAATAAPVGEVGAAPTGFIATDRFGYTGTIERFNSLGDARAGTDATQTVDIGNRDLSLFIRSGLEEPDYNVALGSWWYTTDEQGRAGWGNTRGNTGQGFVQLFDVGGETDTSLDFAFGDFDGTHYTSFDLSLNGEDAGADQVSRLSVFDNVNDGGIFHSYALELTAFGLQGQDSDGDGLIEALNTQPTGVTGSFSGIFQITEEQTSDDNLGFYRFAFDLDMTNWAWENRNDLMTQDEDGNPIEDTFAASSFIAPAAVPTPGTLALLALGLGSLLLRGRRRATS